MGYKIDLTSDEYYMIQGSIDTRISVLAIDLLRNNDKETAKEIAKEIKELRRLYEEI